MRNAPAAAIEDASVSEVDAELEVVADSDVVDESVEVAVVSPVATAVVKLAVVDASLVAESVLSCETAAATITSGRTKEDTRRTRLASGGRGLGRCRIVYCV